jgi:hypothetical protein
MYKNETLIVVSSSMFVLTLGTVMFMSPQQIFLRPHRICETRRFSGRTVVDCLSGFMALTFFGFDRVAGVFVIYCIFIGVVQECDDRIEEKSFHGKKEKKCN